MFKVLFDAIRRGNTEIVEGMLKGAAEMNSLLREKDEWGITLLHWAASLGNAHIIRLLIESGAPVNARGRDGWTPLRWALFLQKNEAADILKRNGATT